jgi:hypothetical protein
MARKFVLFSDSAKFTLLGSEDLLGLTCSNWRYVDENGGGEVCATDDGIPLRLSDREGTLQALKIEFLFAIPPGFSAKEMPSR